MLKLLLCVLSAAVLAALVLQLRQQRQELGYQNSRLYDQIKGQQAMLWNQQLQIAICTAPNAITRILSACAYNPVTPAIISSSPFMGQSSRNHIMHQGTIAISPLPQTACRPTPFNAARA